MKDFEIWKKYLKKNNTIIVWNYYNFMILFCITCCSLFFLNWVILSIILWTIMAICYFIMYKEKNKNIVTSVTVYKFSDIFMEILKSFKLDKKNIWKMKGFIKWNKKK